MNNTDLISVIIPTYNRAHLIRRSAQSVLNQTYKNLELIIVDDGSTDKTKEVIDSINDKRIIYIKQENQGVSAARNTGIEKAKGKYIAFQDSDDVWHLDKLEKQLLTIQKNNADLVFCKQFKFGTLMKRKVPKNIKEGFLQKDILPINIFPQTILSKADILKENKFNIHMLSVEDFELLLRIQKKYSIYCIDEALVDYHVQKDSLSANNERRVKYIKDILNNDKTILTTHSHSCLKLVAEDLLYDSINITDSKEKKEALKFIFTIDKSISLKLKYFFHKMYLYKLRTLIYKTASTTIKKILAILK